MAMSLKKIGELTAERAAIYLFLSRIFREEVDLESLKNLKRSLTKLKTDNPQMAAPYERLNSFLQGVEIDRELIEELSADYASLFLGIGRHPAHPYESVYRSGEGIVMRESRNEVLKVYHAEGVHKTKEFKEPEDHIAIELEFMGYLCLKMKERADQNEGNELLRLLGVQRDFLGKHLVTWVPEFCDDIMESFAEKNFYKAIGEITKHYILLDERSVTQMVRDLAR
jgi:TorA maturation chaperone TorD